MLARRSRAAYPRYILELIAGAIMQNSRSGVLGLTLLLVTSAACGDSSSQGGGGAGAGSNNGADGQGAGNTGGDGGAGANQGGDPTTGGNGGSGGIVEGCDMDVSNVPPGDDNCNLYLQNCPNPADTCEIEDSDPMTGFQPQTVCVNRTGLQGPGDNCNAADECQAHLTCVANACSPFCCPADPNSCLGGECAFDVDLVDKNKEPTGFWFKGCSYAASCDFFDPDTCDPDENCYLNGTGITACIPPSQVPELADGVSCDNLNDCLDSSICIGPTKAESVCRYHCQVGSSAQPGLGGCPNGQTCNTESFDTGFADIGFCDP